MAYLGNAITRNSLLGPASPVSALNFGGKAAVAVIPGGANTKFPRTAYPRKLVRK